MMLGLTAMLTGNEGREKKKKRTKHAAVAAVAAANAKEPVHNDSVAPDKDGDHTQKVGESEELAASSRLPKRQRRAVVIKAEEKVYVSLNHTPSRQLLTVDTVLLPSRKRLV